MEISLQEAGDIVSFIGFLLLILCLNRLDKLGTESLGWGFGLLGGVFVVILGVAVSVM